MSALIDPDLARTFAERGACVVPGVLDGVEVATLRSELETAIEEDLAQRPDVFDRGMVHNCFLRGAAMCALLDHPVLSAWTGHLLAPSCIMYAYQSSSLPPGEGNYGTRIHVDSPRHVPGYMTNLGAIFPLDPFTADNGATWYLPGSHLSPDLPDEHEFRAGAERLFCDAGDLVLFHARLAHMAGTNTTERPRHALTINFCRSFMRQRFDFARMVDESFVAGLGEDARRLIGWYVRVPTSLDEFYLPPEERLYRPGQE